MRMVKKNDEKRYRFYLVLSMVIAVIGVLVAVVKANPIIGAMAVGVAIVIMTSVRRKCKVITTDERIQKISDRAGCATFVFFTLGFMLLYMLNFVHPFVKPMSSDAVGSCLGFISILMLYCYLIVGLGITILGIVLLEVFDLAFLGMGIIFSGLMLIFIGIYWARKPKTEIPADEMHKRINEKAGCNAFWAIIGLMGILVYVNHYFPDLLEFRYVFELMFIVGMFTFVVSRFYYIKRGLL